MPPCSGNEKVKYYLTTRATFTDISVKVAAHFKGLVKLFIKRNLKKWLDPYYGI